MEPERKYDSVGMLHQKHNTTLNRLYEKNAPTMGRKGNERAIFPTSSCTSQEHLKYIDLANVVRTEHKVKTEIVPLVIGAFGSVSRQLKAYIGVIGIQNISGSAQIPPLRAPLEFWEMS